MQPPLVLIDPEQEYTHLVTAMGGVVIDISASSPSHAHEHTQSQQELER
ncbi:hypothetical protein [Gemmiger formicilis]